MPRLPRVLITRAPRQGSELADRLRALGAEPVLIPAIETVPPSSYAALDAALARLPTYDWLIFTSANAAEVSATRIPPHSLPKVQIAAIGPATARALGNHGFTPTLVPPQAVAESLAGALLPHAHPGTRFLLIRAEEARETLPETLRAAGAEVTVAAAYRTVIPPGSATLLRTLFASPENHPDAITFTSSSTARNLFALLEASAVTLPERSLRISIGPITSQTLRDLGHPAHAESPEATVSALAETVIQAVRRGKAPA